MDKYGFFLNLSLNKYLVRQLYHIHPDCFKSYKKFCYLVEYMFRHFISFKDFKFYVSCIPYPSGIICFKNFCCLVKYIFQELYASGISYPSGMFNNSYRYVHIQFFCNYQANQNPKWNCINYRNIYFFIINTRFLQETLLHKSYFVLHNFIKFSYKYPLVFKQALHL